MVALSCSPGRDITVYTINILELDDTTVVFSEIWLVAGTVTLYESYYRLYVCFVWVKVLRPSQQLRSCLASQLPIKTVPGQA